MEKNKNKLAEGSYVARKDVCCMLSKVLVREVDRGKVVRGKEGEVKAERKKQVVGREQK